MYYKIVNLGGDCIELINESQLRKGILEGYLLMIISKGEIYGYEISERFSNFGMTGVSMGTIYPLLTKFEKNNWVLTETKKSVEGPSRKYYSLSTDGENAHQDFLARFDTLTSIFTRIKGE